MKAREVKRAKLVARYAEKRAALKQIVRTGEPADAFEAAQKLQELPKNSNPIRMHNRCKLTGRPKGYIRQFGISRIQFREMEVFTQFSSDLDAATKEQLQYGKGLMELLKQPLCHPMSLHEQVITLCVATHKVLVDVEISKIKDFQKDMLNFFEIEHAEIVNEIEEKKVLSDELIDKIVELAKEFKSRC